MRRALLAALVAGLLLLSGCTDPPAASPGESKIDVDTPQLRALKSETAIEECAPGDATDGGLPDVVLPCLGGGPDVDLAGLQGPLIVNLWASWCNPCKKEMPALQDFYERYGDRVGVLGVDYQDVQPDAAIELASRLGVTYPLVADPGGELNAQDPLPVIRGVPWLILLGADGDVELVPGGVEDTAELVQLSNEHLGTDL